MYTFDDLFQCTSPSIRGYVQCIFPLQPVKGNFPRVMSAVNELRSLARSMVVRPQSRGCLLEGLQDALAQFHRLSQNVRQVSPTLPLSIVRIDQCAILFRPLVSQLQATPHHVPYSTMHLCAGNMTLLHPVETTSRYEVDSYNVLAW